MNSGYNEVLDPIRSKSEQEQGTCSEGGLGVAVCLVLWVVWCAEHWQMGVASWRSLLGRIVGIMKDGQRQRRKDTKVNKPGAL